MNWLDLPGDLPFEDEFGCVGGIAIAVAVVGLIVLSVFFVFPAVIFAIEILILVLLVGGGVLARVILRRPGTIEAVPVAPSLAPGQGSWQVVGWKASGQLLDRVSQDITSGVDPRQSPGPAARLAQFGDDLAERGDGVLQLSVR